MLNPSIPDAPSLLYPFACTPAERILVELLIKEAASGCVNGNAALFSDGDFEREPAACP